MHRWYIYKYTYRYTHSYTHIHSSHMLYEAHLAGHACYLNIIYRPYFKHTVLRLLAKWAQDHATWLAWAVSVDTYSTGVIAATHPTLSEVPWSGWQSNRSPYVGKLIITSWALLRWHLWCSRHCARITVKRHIRICK